MVKAAARRSIEPAKPAEAPSPSNDAATDAPATPPRGKAVAPIVVEAGGTIAPKGSRRSGSKVADGNKAKEAIAPKRARASAKSEAVVKTDEAGTVAAGASTSASPRVERKRPQRKGRATGAKGASHRGQAMSAHASAEVDAVPHEPVEAERPSSNPAAKTADGGKASLTSSRGKTAGRRGPGRSIGSATRSGGNEAVPAAAVTTSARPQVAGATGVAKRGPADQATKSDPAARGNKTSRASARTRVAATIADVVEPSPAEAPSSTKQVSRRDGAKRADVGAAADKALPSATASSSKPRSGGATAAEATAGPPVKPPGAKAATRSIVKSAAARHSTARAPASAGGCAPIKLGFLSDFVGFHLRLAQDASYRAFARFKEKDLVKPGRFPALAIIHLNPGISQSALGRAIARDKSTVSPLIKDLQKNGLINRKPSPNDRRSVTLVLTKKGERVLERLHVRAREHENDLDRLVGASKGKLVGLLDKITAALTA